MSGCKTSVMLGLDRIIKGLDSLRVDAGLPGTAFGETLVGQLHPQFQGSFEYTVDNTDLNTNTVVNGGTVTMAEAMAVLGTSTTTGSSAMFQSKQHARYKAGLGGLMRFTVIFDTPVANTQQLIGLADEVGSSTFFKNGYMLGYIGTVFGLHRFQNDSLITVAQANWDDPMLSRSDPSGMILLHDKLNVAQIRFQYLGGGAIQIEIENDATGLFVSGDKILYANKNTSPSVHNPNFHHTMFVGNGGTTSDIVLRGASYGYFVEGKTKFIELHQPSNSTGLISLGSVSTEAAIFTIRNKTSYQSKTNFIDILLKHITGSADINAVNNVANIRLVKNATLGGVPSYTDINTANSVVEIDVAGTTVTGGTDIIPLALNGRDANNSEQLASLEIIINPGETVTAAGTSAAAATMGSGLLWRELF